MNLPATVTCAPCCLGVDDVSNPHLMHWLRVLDEAAEAGFHGLELGPYGYMPLDVARVGEARGLRIVAGKIFEVYGAVGFGLRARTFTVGMIAGDQNASRGLRS